MNLRPKIIALIATMLGLLGVQQYLIQQRILLPNFAALERTWASNEMARAIHAVDREVDLLDVITRDWGDWSSLYEYMTRRDPRLIDDIISPSEIAAMGIDAVALVDLTGRIVWSYANVPGPGDSADIDLLRAGKLPDDLVWREALHAGTAVHGIVTTNRGLMLVVGDPILNGHAQGPSRGMVLLGRLLTPARIATIGEQAQTALTIYSYRKGDDASSELLPAAAQRIGDESLLVRDQVVEVYKVLNDLNGQPLLTLRVAAPRTISAQGRQVLAYADGLMGLAAAAIVLLLFVALNQLVVKPIRKITQRAAQIGAGKNLDAPLELHRTDELGQLATEIEAIASQSQRAALHEQRPPP